MLKTIRVTACSVLVAVSCHPGHTLAEISETNSEPPSIPLGLAVDSPSFIDPIAGKSLETERIESEKAEKAKKEAEIASQKRASRINHPAPQETPQIRQSEQKQAVSVPKTLYAVEIIGYSNEQCVIYTRRTTGNQKIRGYAGNLIPEGMEYVKGAIVVFRNQGHVGEAIDRKPGFTLVEDANWIKGKITRHWVADSDIKGYIY